MVALLVDASLAMVPPPLLLTTWQRSFIRQVCNAWLFHAFSISSCVRRKGTTLGRFVRRTCSLVLAEKTPADLSCIGAVQRFRLPIDLVVAGPVDTELLSRFRRAAGVRRVLSCTHTSLAHLPADATASLLFDLSKKENPSYICAVSGSVGKDVLPRLGGLLDVQPVTDIVEIKELVPSEMNVSDSKNGIQDVDVFARPIYAGNAIQTLRAHGKPKVLTFRASAFAPAFLGDTECCVEEVAFKGNTQVEWLEETIQDKDKPQLNTAKIVVSGGRGFRTKEDFENLLEPLRKKLGAALGSTKAVVDLGFVPNDLQIGQTGKIVAPDLYLSVGASGAVQHLAGMRGSKVVVAINKDPDAPICKMSDYYLVGDVYKIVPELTDKLKQQ